MARKSSPTPSPFAHIRELFTAAERRVLDSSFGSALSSATHAGIQAASRQARTLRDKWRDLAAAQGRKTKRASTATSNVNARSHEKADAFHGAVERLEQRLAELVATVGAGVGGKGTHPKAKARDKKIAGRATRRTTAKPEAPAPAARRPTPKVAVTKSVAPAVPVRPAAPAAPAAAAPRTPAKKTISRKARVNRAALVPQAGTQGVRFDLGTQRSARTAAKAKRFEIQGSKTKRSAHLVATGKRNQARRDGRKR